MLNFSDACTVPGNETHNVTIKEGDLCVPEEFNQAILNVDYDEPAQLETKLCARSDGAAVYVQSISVLIQIFSDVCSGLPRDQLPVCQVWAQQGLLLDAGLGDGFNDACL